MPSLASRITGWLGGLGRRAAAATRGYDAADRGRRAERRVIGNTSANAEIARALPTLRAVMRDMVRNDPYTAKALSELVVHIVGDGIAMRPNSGRVRTDKRVNDLWTAWCARAHIEGALSWEALQALIVREWLTAGEVIIRRRMRRLRSGGAVPMCLEVLEADQIDSSRDGMIDGRPTVMGVEFTDGAPSAYWLFPVHPGGSLVLTSADSLSSVRVPADEIIHLFDRQRVQTRGVPWGAASVTATNELAGWEDAEAVRKKIEACAVGVVEPGEDDPTIGIPEIGQGPGVYDNSGAKVERFEPGMFMVLRGGRSIKFNQPASIGGTADHRRGAIQRVAAGWRVPYELISGDLSHVSYISGRLGLQSFHRMVSQLQWQIVIPILCERVWEWFVDAAYLAGSIPTANVPMKCSPPAPPSVDRLKDATADLIELRSGLQSYPDKMLARGESWEDTLGEVKAALDLLDRLGIVVDWDVRKVAKSGVMQTGDVATAPDAVPAQ